MFMRIPSRVFIREIQSAPSASTAFAISVISVTFGVSFIMMGFLVAFRTAAVTAAAPSAEIPHEAPPALTLGQEMFTSIISILVASSVSATAT